MKVGQTFLSALHIVLFPECRQKKGVAIPKEKGGLSRASQDPLHPAACGPQACADRPDHASMTPEEKTRLKDLDREIVWHPFTQMREYAQEAPVVIARADGVYLEDIDGKRYLDGFSSVWCNVHGHRVREIDAAVRDQLDQVAHSTLLGLSNVPAIRLAEKLVDLAPPGLTHVFYSDNGATAVEVALKMALQYWRQRDEPRPEKETFLHLSDSYHGDTLGAVSVGGIPLFHERFRPLLFSSLTVPAPHPYRCSFCAEAGGCNEGCLVALEDILKRRADRIAAFVVEPLVQGAGGLLVHPEGYLKRAADLCQAYDVLLIADEVATGFGRTGTMFACDQEGVSPDVLCLGKGLTGGYLPVAATMASDRIYEAFLGDYSERKTFFHGHTYTGNPLGCAAALAALDLFERDATLDALQPKIGRLREGLARFERLEQVGEVRQRGLIAAVELVENRASRRPYPWEARVGVRVCREARERGLLIRPLGNTIVLMPPLAIRMETLDRMLDITYESIRVVTEPSRAE